LRVKPELTFTAHRQVSPWAGKFGYHWPIIAGLALDGDLKRAHRIK
jgi:hypothetical protein